MRVLMVFAYTFASGQCKEKHVKGSINKSRAVWREGQSHVEVCVQAYNHSTSSLPMSEGGRSAQECTCNEQTRFSVLPWSFFVF